MRHRARYISQLTDKPAEFADIFIARRQAAASEHNNTAAGTDRLGCCTHASTNATIAQLNSLINQHQSTINAQNSQISILVASIVVIAIVAGIAIYLVRKQ